MASNTPVLLATTNSHKLTELRNILREVPFPFLTPQDLENSITSLEVDETGATFAQNALLKARTFSQASGLVSVADDSGLEVVALNGEPGVRSARWVAGSDAERTTALLHRLAGIQDRSAQFSTVACVYHPDGTHVFFTGTVNGSIAAAPRGSNGFGYDPIFIPEGHSQTFAELGAEIKNSLSHRARAFEQVAKYFVKLRL